MPYSLQIEWFYLKFTNNGMHHIHIQTFSAKKSKGTGVWMYKHTCTQNSYPTSKAAMVCSNRAKRAFKSLLT